MNRRFFFRSLAATALVAVASQKTLLASSSLRLVDDPMEIGRSYAEYLARSLVETKETLTANLLRSFET